MQNMILLLHVDASLNTGGLLGSQGGYICGVTDQSLLDGESAPWSPLAWRSFKMSRTVLSTLGAEAQAMSVVLGFVEWVFDLRGAPAVIQERPPVCVTDCKSLCDHLLAVGSPTTLQDKRSAIYVLIIRDSLQLADGLTKDKGEAVECLRRSLRSGSYMLRNEEQVMHERQLSRTSKKLKDKLTVEQS